MFTVLIVSHSRTGYGGLPVAEVRTPNVLQPANGIRWQPLAVTLPYKVLVLWAMCRLADRGSKPRSGLMGGVGDTRVARAGSAVETHV